MEIFDLMPITVFLFIAAFLVFGVVAVTDMMFYTPYAAQDALEQCLDRGYDYASEFDKPLFATTAYGVECAIIEYDRKQIDIDSDGAIPIIVS